MNGSERAQPSIDIQPDASQKRHGSQSEWRNWDLKLFHDSNHRLVGPGVDAQIRKMVDWCDPGNLQIASLLPCLRPTNSGISFAGVTLSEEPQSKTQVCLFGMIASALEKLGS